MEWIKKIWTVTWKVGTFLLLWACLYAPALSLISLGSEDGEAVISPAVRLFLEVVGAVAVVGAAWVVVRFIDRRTLRDVGFALRPAAPEFFAGVVVGGGMIAFAVGVLLSAGWARVSSPEAFDQSALFLMCGAMLFNAVTQEVICRGVVLQVLERTFGLSTAVLGSSVFFVLLHAGAIAEGGLLPAINLLAAGLLLALAYTTTRNLWLAIGLHFTWNALQGPVLGIAVTGHALDSGRRVLEMTGPEVITGGAFGLEGGLAGTVATIGGIFVVIALHGFRRRRAASVTREGSS